MGEGCPSVMPSKTPNAPQREQHGFARVAAAVPALKLGDVSVNSARILELWRRAALEQGASLVVFPELALTGASAADLFFSSALLEAAWQALEPLASAGSNLAAVAVVGLPLRVDGRLYNVAAVLGAGRVLGLVPKTWLPNAGEFYERRWFSAAEALNRSIFSGIPIGSDLLFEALDLPHWVLGVEICEDLWTVIPPSSTAALCGATILANPSASPEVVGKAAYRCALVQQQSARCLAAYIYCSSGAGESSTDLLYSGHAMIADQGIVLTQSRRFEFAGQCISADVDLHAVAFERLHSTSFRDAPSPRPMRRVRFEFGGRRPEGEQALQRPLPALPFVPDAPGQRDAACEEIYAIQSTALARRLMGCGARRVVLGLSGGLDSTLALLVGLEALQRCGLPLSAMLAVTMPGPGTGLRTLGNACALAEALGVELRNIPIGPAVAQHLADIGHREGLHDVTFENAQARERTQILMDLANQEGGIVLGTGDLSEAALGWCTFNGDHISHYHVNVGVPKTLVRHLVHWAAGHRHPGRAGEILLDVVDTPISPELLPAAADGSMVQQTEETLGPYEVHDFLLYHLLRRGADRQRLGWLLGLAFEPRYPKQSLQRWLEVFLARFAAQQFKRSVMPDGPKVGSVALSPRGDWRMPSDWAGPLC